MNDRAAKLNDWIVKSGEKIMANTVLITGASQGTGKATALLFARHGYDVILAARQPERLEQVAAAVRAKGRQALAVPTDTADAQQVESLIQKAIARFGRVDVLVNNAGFYLSGLADAIWSAVREGKSEVIVGQPMTATEALQVAV
jgi:NADP-dependent 3-hydroxy acid dehydrogenase YdfG